MSRFGMPVAETPPLRGGPNAERAHACAREASLFQERGAR